MQIDAFRGGSGASMLTRRARDPHHAPADEDRGAVQNEPARREQSAAFKMLRSAIPVYLEQQKVNRRSKKTPSAIFPGNQIRSYVFQPYQLVKDRPAMTGISSRDDGRD